MRKIIVVEFMSLDSVIQAPGGPEEDPSGGFQLGGWCFPLADEVTGEAMGEQMKNPADLLLGRKTYEIFASYWPQNEADWPGVNDATKYVVSSTLTHPTWKNTVIIGGDATSAIKALKTQDGPDLKLWGSGNLAQTLFEHGLVDEMWLKIFPLVLGSGKRLFSEGAMPGTFQLTKWKASPSGVIIANYERAGEVKTGSF